MIMNTYTYIYVLNEIGEYFMSWILCVKIFHEREITIGEFFLIVGKKTSIMSSKNNSNKLIFVSKLGLIFSGGFKFHEICRFC